VGKDLLVRVSRCSMGRRGAVTALCCAGALAAVAPQASAAAPAVPAASVGPAQLVSPSPVLNLATTPVSSGNWEGYVTGESAGATFTEVTTTYKQPVVTCPVANAFTVFWVGFDGFNDSTVEQDGTGAECVGTTPAYFAWWEMYPTNSIQPFSMSVAPGNKIKATVSYAAGTSQYTMTVSNLTTGQENTQTATCGSGQQCLRAVAEWITERPSSGGGLEPLAKFRTFAFNGDKAAATPSGAALKPISHFTNDRVTMVSTSNGATLAKAGKLASGGTSFTNTWVRTQ
jgi:Peptidase A4 family